MSRSECEYAGFHEPGLIDPPLGFQSVLEREIFPEFQKKNEGAEIFPRDYYTLLYYVKKDIQKEAETVRQEVQVAFFSAKEGDFLTFIPFIRIIKTIRDIIDHKEVPKEAIRSILLPRRPTGAWKKKALRLLSEAWEISSAWAANPQEIFGQYR